jgi:SAM-dependent methyltransferase
MTIDPDRLNALMERMLHDMGAAMSGALVGIGDQLGLFRTLADSDGLTPAELAERTGTNERYVREWLSAMAAAGWVDYTPQNGRFVMTPEQKAVFGDESSPVFSAGAFQVIRAAYHDMPAIAEAFRSGRGVGWHEHHPDLYCGTERFFRPGYTAHLTGEWIPALDGVEERLQGGARVADVGCGHGASTIIMARAYPRSSFVGFDYHPSSVERARENAVAAGVDDRVQFEVARAQDFPGDDWDLVAIFDALHDMGDPVSAARNVRRALADDGTWMLVEPFAHDELVDNLNPVGRMFYAASTMFCTPSSLAQEVGLALGAQAGERRLAEICRTAGFSRVRRASETPFNMVLEVRP